MSSFLESLGQGQQAILRERKKVRWWYVVGLYPAKNQWGSWAGPFNLTDGQIYTQVRDQISTTPGLEIYRLVYSPLQRVWIWDLRSMESLGQSASPIPGYDNESMISGASQLGRVGVVPVVPPMKGRWPFAGFPDVVSVMGGTFRKARWSWPRPGVVMQYREAVPSNSRHLFVLKSGAYVVSHKDEVNPDLASPAEHFIRDVMKRPDTMSPLEASLRAKAPEL